MPSPASTLTSSLMIPSPSEPFENLASTSPSLLMQEHMEAGNSIAANISNDL
jgi:hypothetical protein